MNYSKHYSTKQTPQSQPIPGEKQVKNNAGGYVYEIDHWQRLRRFLILGSEGNTYYQGERELTVENAENVITCIKEDGKRAVDLIVEVSQKALAPKNDAAIFALALATKFGDMPTRRHAFDSVGSVCRIGTHIFQFVAAREAVAGWGRGMKRAIKNWYLNKPAERIALQLVKYQQRNGWSHRDLLRLAHPKTDDPLIDSLFSWVTNKKKENKSQLVIAFEEAKTADKKELMRLIAEYNLTREMIPTEYLNDQDIQWLLLQKMPYIATLRNLGNFSKSGLLKPMSDSEKLVISRLEDLEQIRESRVHPFQILLALKTYSSGAGFRGDGRWIPCPRVVDALDTSFYSAFKFVEPTGQRFFLGIDVSGSMTGVIANSNISSAEAAAAMAMTTYRTEKESYAFGFANEFRDLGISPKMSMKDVLQKTTNQNFGSTNCALPILYALKNKIKVDAFCVYTDNETWAGGMHPKQALDKYRQAMGIPAKLIACAFTATNFSIADPNDGGMLDCAGLDASLPTVIAEFAKGAI